MYAFITYKEISDILEKKFRVRPTFSRVGDRAVKMSCKYGMIPNVTMDFYVESIDNDCICFSYDCNLATSMVIAGVIALIENNFTDGIDISTAEKLVKINLKSFRPLSKVLEYMTLYGVSFDAEAVNLHLSLLC